MARQVDKISNLIHPKYFSWIREAIVQHGNVNIQALSDKFNILAGNTYFRNFIKDKDQEYLGISGLTSIVDECGYELKLVPVKKNDLETYDLINNVIQESFSDIREKVSSYAHSVKRDPKNKNKKKKKVIDNASLINDCIMGLEDSSPYDDDDDEIIIGTGNISDMNRLDF